MKYATIVDTCATNASLLDSMNGLGLLGNTSLNITELAIKQIDAFNISGVSKFDVNSVIEVDSPSEKISTMTNVDLNKIESTTLNNIVFSNVPELRKNMSSLAISLNNLNSTLNIGFFNLFGSNSGQTRNEAVLADFRPKLNNINLQLNQIDILLSQISSSASSLNGTMISVRFNAANLIVIFLITEGFRQNYSGNLQYICFKYENFCFRRGE